MKKLTIVVTAAVGILTLGLAMPALAAPEFDVPSGPPTVDGRDFADHVVHCAQEGMIGKDCNLGVCHQGLANFENCEH